jgi:hypothetical protein
LQKPLKSNNALKFIALLCVIPTLCAAQEAWKFNSSLTAMTGNYKDSLTMGSQHGTGLRVTGEYNQKWGVTGGLQSTRINMEPITRTAKQDQDNWLLSGYLHTPSTGLPGRWTLQLDGHQIHNDDPTGQSDGVRVIAPQITWLSYSQPLKLDLGYASSSYRNTSTVHQVSYGLGFGFNQNQDWVQMRGHLINKLNPSYSLGQISTRGADVKLTHFLQSQITGVPNSLTLGLERGKKVYNVDMQTQTVYNLPMVNEGGESIAATWALSNQTNLSLQANSSRYYSELVRAHNFTLNTLSAQLATAW